jgi:predicted PurR-regulated permease PerM
MGRRVADQRAAAGPATPAPKAEPAPDTVGPITPEPFGTVSRRVTLTLLTVVAAYLLVRLRGLVVLVLLSGLLAYVLSPVVDRVSRLAFGAFGRPLPRWGAVLVVFVGAGVLLVATGLLLVPPLIEQIAALVKRLPDYYEQAVAIVEDIRRISRAQLPSEWRQTIESYIGQAGGFAIGFLQSSIGALVTVLASVVAIVVVPILTWFMLLAAPGVRGSILAWFPPRLKPEVDFLVAEVNLVMLKFLRGRLMVAGVVGVLVGLGTWALGVPYPLVLGLSAGLLDLIPFVGPVLAAVPALFLTLFGDSGRVLLVVGLYVAVQQIEQFVLSPKIEGGELKLNPAVVILAATAAGTLFGVLGVLLAVPITALTRIVLLYVRAKLRGEPLESVENGHAASGER